MVTNILLIGTLFALAYGEPKVQLMDDYVIKTAGKGNRLSGWNVLRPNNTKCDMVRRQIKTFGYCWKDENEEKGINTDKERRWVREVIQQWEKCGGIKFVQESQCRDGPDFISIHVGNYHPAVVPYIDNSCGIFRLDMFLNFYTFGVNIEDNRRTEKVREAAIKVYALHEFGHYIGFDHEHNRNDRKDPGHWRCETKVDESQIGPKPSTSNTHITKEYDTDSIMNYCRPNVHYKPWLSALDKKGVRDAYGGGNEKECDAITKRWTWGPGEGLDETALKHMNMEANGITCYDVMETDRCVMFGCDSETLRENDCRKTCGTCSVNGEPVVKPTKPPATTAAPAGCADIQSAENCQGWKELCHDKGTQHWCAKTCGVC